MDSYVVDISAKARKNTYFRQVLQTGKNTQIVVMNIPPGDEIGEEVHEDTDQVLYFVEGTTKATLNGEEKNSTGTILYW